MTCRDHRRRLSLDLDGELLPELRRSLEDHLAGCAECRAERQLWLRIREVLHEEDAAALGDGVVIHVLEGIRRRRESERQALPFARRVAVAAALLLLASLGVLAVLRPDRPTSLSPRAGEDLGRVLLRDRVEDGALGLSFGVEEPAGGD